MCAAQIFKVTSISAPLVSLSSLGLKKHHVTKQVVRFGSVWIARQGLREHGLWHSVQKISLLMSINKISWFKKTSASNGKKVSSRQPLQNKKWQEVGMCSCVTDRNMWAFEDLKAVVYSRRQTSEVACLVENSAFPCPLQPLHWQIKITHSQSSTRHDHCPLLNMKSTHQHYIRLLAFYIFPSLVLNAYFFPKERNKEHQRHSENVSNNVFFLYKGMQGCKLFINYY